MAVLSPSSRPQIYQCMLPRYELQISKDQIRLEFLYEAGLDTKSTDTKFQSHFYSSKIDHYAIISITLQRTPRTEDSERYKLI